MVILEEVSSSVSCSSTPQWKYHVFLSFRGTDTRLNFTGHLYNALIQKGINTYMDDAELPKGEEISSELLQAIQDSKISIIVFSENYASSSWCLDELVKILKCKKSNQQVLVHPIFYKVEPSDLGHLKGSFGEALAKHECRFKDNLEKVEEWKKALSEAANLSGWTLPITKNKSEPIFIDKIVEEISRQLISRTYMDAAKYPVGVEPRVEAVMKLLGDLKGSKDVRMVGIWGTGGMGKTTLAKAVYNSIAHQFEGCCFLENVRENSMSYRGRDIDKSIDNSKICKLQEKLLSQILGGKQFIVDSASKGITMIKEKLKWRRVLIVLDDVNDMDQLDNLAGESGWFGKGSRVIITTRDMQLLRAHNVDLMYNIKELDYYEAFELFSRNALKRNEPLEVYKDLIDRAIVRAQGLPLALSVLGSSLCGKRVERWQATIDSFKSNKIQEVLKISYDGLEETTKELFLDIACFFKGQDRRHVIQMLEGCGLKPEHEIEDLIEKALIRIDWDGRVTMHDLLEEMGKDIVKQESPNDPGERSRLWFHNDVYHVLTENSGTRKIIGMKVELPQDYKICLTVGTFFKMLNLRLFICHAGSFSGVLDYLPNSLRVVDWPNCPFDSLPSNFNPRNLAVLKMLRSRIREIGKTWKNLTNLTSINLSHCKYLKKVSDLSGVPNLECLDLSWCPSLVEVDDSIGRLDRLCMFDLKECSRLTNFPTSVTWKSLTHLCLNDCTTLEIFIKFVNKMESIEILNLRNTGIKELPSWIGYLTSLVKLNLSQTPVKELPSSIGNLTSLEELNLSGTLIKELPSSIGNLTSLVELGLSGTPVKELPSSIGNLTSLLELDLSGTPVKELPSSIGNLTSLLKLDLYGTPVKELPSSIGNLTSLVDLYLSGTPVKELPSSIGNLTSLVDLYLSGTPVKELPSSIGNLTSLVDLNLSRTPVKELPSSIGNLTSLVDLNLSGTPVKELPSSIGNLTSLVDLNLSGTPVKELPSTIGNLTSLKKLDASRTLIKDLPSSIGNLTSLVDLNLSGTPVKELPSSIGNLTSLVELNLSGTLVKELPSSIGNLTSLVDLYLSRTLIKDLPSSIGNLTSLLKMDASRTLIKDLPLSIGNLFSLGQLYLQECENLGNVPDSVYGGLPFLHTLDLSWCPNLVTTPTNPDTCNSASSLFLQLRVLRFKGCNLLSITNFLSNLDCTSTLWSLDLSESSFDSLPAFISNLAVTHLFLSDCKWLRDITELPRNTISVDLRDCVALERFSTFSNILEQRGNRPFEKMDLSGCYRLVENLGIEELVSKFEKAFQNQLVNNGRAYEYSACSVKFPILRGNEVPEWFDKHVLPENTCEIVIEIPPSLKWEKTGLAVCLVYETDPNFICVIYERSMVNGGIEIKGHLYKKRNGPNETEWSKFHDHVWLHCFPLRRSMMRERCVIRISSELFSVMRIKSWGVHLTNLAEDIPIDDDYNGEGAAAISELSDATIHTKRGLESVILYDDHPNKRISHQARSSCN